MRAARNLKQRGLLRTRLQVIYCLTSFGDVVPSFLDDIRDIMVELVGRPLSCILASFPFPLYIEFAHGRSPSSAYRKQSVSLLWKPIHSDAPQKPISVTCPMPRSTWAHHVPRHSTCPPEACALLRTTPRLPGVSRISQAMTRLLCPSISHLSL